MTVRCYGKLVFSILVWRADRVDAVQGAVARRGFSYIWADSAHAHTACGQCRRHLHLTTAATTAAV